MEEMYAIIRAGGKQAKVQEGDILDIERVKGTDQLTFTPLLIVKDDGTVISDRGKLEKAKVLASVVGEHRGDKVEVFKYKPKTGYRRSQGHRQHYTTIEINKIQATASRKKKAEPAESEAAAETIDESKET
jgi:large subunit ribosomal protein L21